MMTGSDSKAHSPRGLNKILETPWVYNFWQQITGADKWKQRLMRNHVKPFEGARILDIGCGTGVMLNFIDKKLKTEYVGCDINPDYICHAAEKFGSKGKFYCCNADSLPEHESGFDIILAAAILHHLNDISISKLIADAKSKLKQGGVFIISEPVWTNNQSWFEKYLMKNDRGKNIKNENGYLEIIKERFYSASSEIICNSHLIPWTVIVIKSRDQS